jgi:hypothetical protein
MPPSRRHVIGAAFAALFSAGSRPPLAFGDEKAVTLAEEIRPGDYFRYEIGLEVGGKMKVERDGRDDSLPLNARARHQFTERVDVAADNGVGQAVRHYADAVSETVVGVDKTRRTLGADRRLIVAQRAADGTLHFSPDGPLTRDELDLVAEHFDTLCLPGLLPNKAVRPGDTWPIDNGAAQAACLFHGLAKNDLVGKLTEIKDGAAVLAITGSAEGVEFGAAVKVAVTARAKFDLAVRRVTALEWKQSDEREAGPVSPPLEVKATVTLSRLPLEIEPKELSAAARAKVPTDGKVPELLLQLRYADTAGRFQFVYPRDWHFVVRNNTHVVLRLVPKGELLTQATITEWKKPAAGVDFAAGVKEFREATAKQPGWEAERLLEDGTLPADGGKKVYRMSAIGKQDGQPVVQAFHLVLGPNGEQFAVTTVARREVADKVGPRDVALVHAIDFPAKK